MIYFISGSEDSAMADAGMLEKWFKGWGKV